MNVFHIKDYTTLHTLIKDTNPRYVGICVKTETKANTKYLKLIVIPTLGEKEYNYSIVREVIKNLNEDDIYRILGGVTLDAISIQYLSASLDFEKGDDNGKGSHS